MKTSRRIAFGVCGFALIIFTILAPTDSVVFDRLFVGIGFAYVMIALWWPNKKENNAKP